MTENQLKTSILSAKTPAALASRARYRFGSYANWPDWLKEAARVMKKPIKRYRKKKLNKREKEFRMSEREVIKERARRGDGIIYCEVCGKPILEEPQMGHLISQSDPNIKSFTVWFIHSAINQKACCSLECNHAAAISQTGEEFWEHFGEVISYLRTHPVVPSGAVIMEPHTKLEVPV